MPKNFVSLPRKISALSCNQEGSLYIYFSKPKPDGVIERSSKENDCWNCYTPLYCCSLCLCLLHPEQRSQFLFLKTFFVIGINHSTLLQLYPTTGTLLIECISHYSFAYYRFKMATIFPYYMVGLRFHLDEYPPLKTFKKISWEWWVLLKERRMGKEDTNRKMYWGRLNGQEMCVEKYSSELAGIASSTLPWSLQRLCF